MIGVDTNVFVRFLVADDPRQHASAVAFMSARTDDDPAFVSFVVLAEAVWYLIKVRKVPVALAADTFRWLLLSPGIVFEDQDFLEGLFDAPLDGDIADHLIAHSAKRAGATVTMTFDRRAARDVPGMKLLT